MNSPAGRRTAKAAMLAILGDLPSWDGPEMTVALGFEPLQLAGNSPVAACWYEGEAEIPEGRMTLGNRMTGRRYVIRCYWAIMQSSSPEARVAVEEQIEDAERAILKALWDDTVLDESITAIYVPEPTEVGWSQMGDTGPFCRVLNVPVTLVELEGEAINP